MCTYISISSFSTDLSRRLLAVHNIRFALWWSRIVKCVNRRRYLRIGSIPNSMSFLSWPYTSYSGPAECWCGRPFPLSPDPCTHGSAKCVCVLHRKKGSKLLADTWEYNEPTNWEAPCTLDDWRVLPTWTCRASLKATGHTHNSLHCMCYTFFILS